MLSTGFLAGLAALALLDSNASDVAFVLTRLRTAPTFLSHGDLWSWHRSVQGSVETLTSHAPEKVHANSTLLDLWLVIGADPAVESGTLMGSPV